MRRLRAHRINVYLRSESKLIITIIMTRFEVLIKETAKILYFGCFWLYVGLNSSPIDNTTGCANKADFWLHFFCGELGTFLKMYAISKKWTLFIRNLSSCWDRDNNDGIWRNGENKRWFGLKSNLASHIPPHCWLIVVLIEKSQSNGFFFAYPDNSTF